MEQTKETNAVHYNAFISYRHSELDSEIASGLHKRLEAFSLPKNLRKKFPKEMHKIRRVFRDTEELPLADNLSDPIDQALRNSDWLIVICSPRLKESLWCAKEVELFSQYHGKEHILAVLAEGEPADSFPEAICFREKKFTDAEGKEQIIREDVEPLAADVRGETASERKKKMDDAVLRMAAPMYGLGYDDLKQRHREQRIRRIASLSALAAAVLLIYAVTSTVLTLRINEQKQTIEEQHAELREQYSLQQIKYAQSMAVVSGELLRQGQGQAAAYAVRGTMPDEMEGSDLPYIPSCRYALSNALGIYEADTFIPESTMEIPDDDFWTYDNEYRFLEDYLGGYQVMCADEFDDSHVLIVTSNAGIYLYNEKERLLTDYTLSFFSEEPDNYVSAAEIKKDMLYILFSQSSYVSCYRLKSYEDYESAGKGDLAGLSENKGIMAAIGDAVESDDGEYLAVQGNDHSLRIYKESDSKLKHPLKAIYDIKGQLCSMKKLEGTDYYLIVYSGKFSYLLDENLDVIARVANFYDYDEDEEAFILYHCFDGDKDYELYYVPLLTYEEIIEQADEYLEDFEPNEEMLERYQMLSY